jgi:hypothetical protein
MSELELKISENTFDTKATKEWFFTFDFDGEQHLIVLPYKKYAQLCELAFSKLSVDEVRNILR